MLLSERGDVYPVWAVAGGLVAVRGCHGVGKRAASGVTRRGVAAGGGTGARLPTPSRSAEIILRQGFVIDATGKQQRAVPEVVIVANREGLEYLSGLFAYAAGQARRERDRAPADPVHLPRGQEPINVRLSDDMDIRVAPLTSANRAATFRRYGVTLQSRQKGSLFDRYRDIAATQYQKVARRIDEPFQPPGP